MLEFIENPINIDKLINLCIIDKNIEVNSKHFSQLELIFLNIHSNIIFLDSRNTDFIQLNTDLISFLYKFKNDEVLIQDFIFLQELNGLKWSELHRKWQRKIEQNDLSCCLIRPNTSDQELKNIMNIIHNANGK